MSEAQAVGKTVLARMFAHTVKTRILETRVGYGGRVECRLEVPPDIIAEIRKEAHPNSFAWKSTEAFWTRLGAIGYFGIDAEGLDTERSSP